MAIDQGNISTPAGADLNTAARRYAASQGWAMSDGSYPIRPANMHGRTDLQNAVHAIGRGSGSHAAIRAHIIKRARALGLVELLPQDWDVSRSETAAAEPGVQYRSFTPDLELRSDGDGRTIVGIAVPYGKPQRIDARLTEQFRSGAFDAQLRSAPRVPFAREHLPLGGTLIGTTAVLRNDAAGLYGEWRVSRTPAGDETLELVKDGALSDLSVGFREGQNARLPGGIVERVTARLKEVAVVMTGAYGEHAAVAGVRSAGCACGCHDELAGVAEADRVLASLPVLPL